MRPWQLKLTIKCTEISMISTTINPNNMMMKASLTSTKLSIAQVL
jgi:hypothetical protein